MKNYYFETSIPANKTITLPIDFDLINQEVDIIIIPKNNERKITVKDFLDKWSGEFQEIKNESQSATKLDEIMFGLENEG